MINCDSSSCKVNIPPGAQAPPTPTMGDVFAAAFYCSGVTNYMDYLTLDPSCVVKPVTGLPLLSGQFTLLDAVGKECVSGVKPTPRPVYLPSLQVVQDICSFVPGLCKGSYPKYPSCV